MKKRAREACRERAEARKQYARSNERVSKEKIEKLEEGVRKALVDHTTTWDERQLKYLDPGPRSLVQTLLKGPGRRLICSETKAALTRLGNVVPLRSVSDWKPQGKGRDSVFRSLCEHLLARFPTPRFLWSVFEESNEQTAALLVPLVVHVAGGGSLFQYCKGDKVPFTLTRAQCLEFIKTPADVGIISALRRVQVKTEGGDHGLYEVWRNLEQNKVLGTAREEEFNLTVLRFFARNPMLNRSQIAPLCDYIFRRCRRVPGFSMQGRTVAALTRDMNEWHGELNHGRVRRFAWWAPVVDGPPVKFERSGFKAFRTEREDGRAAKSGFTNVLVWTIQEILSSDALREEGKRMHHCVYSYRADITEGRTSIWTLACADDLMGPANLVTLEVNNKTRTIVQARGVCNRKTEAREDRIILEWAGKNALSVTYGRYW